MQTRSVADIDTDGNGQFSIQFGELNEVAHAAASAEGGYVINQVSVSGNTVTFEVYETAGANGEMALNTNTADLTSVNATAFGE
jgi:hypothetical protein